MLRQHHRDLNINELCALYAEELSALSEATQGCQIIIDILSAWDAKLLKFEDPGKRLPIEIMSSIFVLAASESPRPSYIAQVCRSWRHLAFNTPAMWATFAGGTEPVAEFRELSVCMERSKGLPLTIRMYHLCEEIPGEKEKRREPSNRQEGSKRRDTSPYEETMSEDEQNTSEDEEDAIICATLDAIVPHASRWQSVTISTNVLEMVEEWLTARRTISTPILEDLHFIVSGARDSDIYIIDALWPFEHTPKLHTLDVGRLDFDLAKVGGQLVELRAMVEDNWLKMLGQCPQLQRLYLKFVQPPSGIRHDRIELCSLVELKLRFVDWGSLIELFLHAHMPLVETLALELNLETSEDSKSFKGLPSTNFPKLHQLSVMIEETSDDDDEPGWVEHDLLDLLPMFRTVTHFSIEKSQHFNVFTHQLEDGALFPYLTHLDLRHCINIDWDCVHLMLESRGKRAGSGDNKTIRRLGISKCGVGSSMWKLPETRALVEEFEWLL